MTPEAFKAEPSSAADPVAIARKLAPLLATSAGAAEKDRPSAESISALRGAELFRLMLPKRAGGNKLIHPVETVAELARAAPTSAIFGWSPAL